MQIHHLALILAGLAGVLVVLLFKLAVAVRQQRRGAVFAAPKAPRKTTAASALKHSEALAAVIADRILRGRAA